VHTNACNKQSMSATLVTVRCLQQ